MNRSKAIPPDNRLAALMSQGRSVHVRITISHYLKRISASKLSLALAFSDVATEADFSALPRELGDEA